MDDSKDYYDEDTMMKRRTRTYIWFPLDDTLFYTPDITTSSSSLSQIIVTLSSSLCTKSSVSAQHHHIGQSTASLKQVYLNASNNFVFIIICGRNDEHGQNMTTNSRRRLTC